MYMYHVGESAKCSRETSEMVTKYLTYTCTSAGIHVPTVDIIVHVHTISKLRNYNTIHGRKYG